MTNAEKIVQACDELAFPYGTKKAKYKYKHKKGTKVKKYDSDRPTKANKKAFDKIFKDHWEWGSTKHGYGQRTNACCDDFAALIVRYAGVDKKFPHATGTLLKGYKSDHFKRIKYTNAEQLKEGDIIVYKKTNGGEHVIIYAHGKRCDAGLNNRYGCYHKMRSTDLAKGKFKYGYIYRAKG